MQHLRGHTYRRDDNLLFFHRSHQGRLRTQQTYLFFEFFDPVLEFRDGISGFFERFLGILTRAFDLVRDSLNGPARLLDALLLVSQPASEAL